MVWSIVIYIVLLSFYLKDLVYISFGLGMYRYMEAKRLKNFRLFYYLLGTPLMIFITIGFVGSFFN